MKVLFIFNGMIKNQGKLSLSGGDMRLLEIIKNAPDIERYVLTTPNGIEFLDKYEQRYKKAYVIDHTIGGGILDNLIISLKSLFYGKTGAREFRDGVVYSSCEHLYDVLPALRQKIFNKNKWYAVYHWVEDYPWREKRGNTPSITRYVYWLNRVFSGLIIKLFADKILAVSDQTKEKLVDIKHINPAKIKAVYCGVEYSKIDGIVKKYKNEKGIKYDAVFMKRLNYGKGVFDLLMTWKKVVAEKPDAKLAVMGDGSEDVLGKVNDFIKKNNLQKNIDILGVVYDFERKFRVINSSKVFLLPTHEENWAIVIGEAMACETPVVCTRLKEIEPIWKDNVVWCRLSDTKDFATQTLKLINNKTEAARVTKKAKTFVKQYEWETIASTELT